MKSPTPRLVAGLLFTLLVIGSYAAYTVHSVSRMRQVQAGIVDRNRRGSLQLIRIQNDLNALALAMRDMLDDTAQYPLAAWKAPLARIRQNLEDAIAKEAALAQSRSPEQTAFLKSSFAEFWRAGGAVFDQAVQGKDPAARQLVRSSLQPRQEALSALIARLLVENNDAESRGGQQVEEIYKDIEANAYRFLAASVFLVVLMSVSLIRANRTLFEQLAGLADQRRELARQLISTQESTFRAISRDLHDEFGQILTALGAMLRRAERHAPAPEFHRQIQEATQTVQGTLENIRSLSQSLQPVIPEEQGLLAAIEWHLPVFERQTGIRVNYHPPAARADVRPEAAIHVFRILQESLNNVARHAAVEEVKVTLEAGESWFSLTIEDRGSGIAHPLRPGIGLTAMRERAELIGGTLEIGPGKEGGTRVYLRVPNEAGREAPVA
ncbi:MAG: sensor histidine kinase [Acidobacteriia bacterium]|nr:sensor histidine kinase [Terriglobia bacterium]